MRKFVKVFIPLVILGAGVTLFAALKATGPERQTAEIQERIWRVEVEEVAPGSLSPRLSLYGRVETPELLEAAASGSARVEQVAVRDGDRVVEGQLLVQLDERDFWAELNQAQALVAELQAQIDSDEIRFRNDQASLEQERKLVDLALAGVERARRLKKQRVGSGSDLDAAEETLARQELAVGSREMNIADHPPRLRVLEARLQGAQARLDGIELDLTRARVTAPFDGIVAGVEVTAGDQVKEDAVLLRMYSIAGLEIRAHVPAPYQAEVAGAMLVEGGLAAEAEVAGTHVRLRLSRLAGEARASGVDGLFTLVEGADVLRLGQMIQLSLIRPLRQNAVALPYQAVYGGDRIYKLVAGRMRGIQAEFLGGWGDAAGGERLLVRSPDLAAGDLVVVTHMPNAIDGLRVEALR